MRNTIAVLFAIIVINASCKTNNQKEIQAKQKAEALWIDISNGKAENDFSTKYFPKEQTDALLYDFQNKCDFKNRQGHFINEYYPDGNIGTKERISFIYEYYMKCDSIRFILTYNIKDTVELYEFKMEPIEKYNSRITQPERRLKF